MNEWTNEWIVKENTKWANEWMNEGIGYSWIFCTFSSSFFFFLKVIERQVQLHMKISWKLKFLMKF